MPKPLNPLSVLKSVLFAGAIAFGPDLWAQTLTGELSPREQAGGLEESKSRYWGSWNLGLGARTSSDLTDQQTYASVRLNLLGGTRLMSGLEIASDISIAGTNGFSQSRFGQGSMGSGININEVIVKVNDEGTLSFDAGIINQRFLRSGLLVSDLPFPGLRQKLKTDFQIKDSKIELGLIAQQAIPSSRSLNNQTRSEKEKTPSFMTQTAYAEIDLTEESTVHATYSRFQYNNLPTSVAFTSRLLGNNVPFSSAAQSKFLFDFAGELYTIDGCYKILENICLKAGAELLENNEAPEAFNRGFLAKVGLNIGFSDHQLELIAADFFNESDSSPAFYNSSRLGHNNMDGKAYSGSFTFKNLFRVRVQYSDADVISANLVNTRRQDLSVALETIYVDF